MDPQEIQDYPDSPALHTHQSSAHVHTHRYPNTTFFCTSRRFIDCIIEQLLSVFALLHSSKHGMLRLLQALDRLVVHNVVWRI